MKITIEEFEQLRKKVQNTNRGCLLDILNLVLTDSSENAWAKDFILELRGEKEKVNKFYTWMEEKKEEYVSEQNPFGADERYGTEQELANVELNMFLTWMKNNGYFFAG